MPDNELQGRDQSLVCYTHDRLIEQARLHHAERQRYLYEIWFRQEYKLTHASFSDFCEQVIGCSGSTARRVMKRWQAALEIQGEVVEPEVGDEEPKPKAKEPKPKGKASKPQDNLPEILVVKDQEGRQIPNQDVAKLFFEFNQDIKGLETLIRQVSAFPRGPTRCGENSGKEKNRKGEPNPIWKEFDLVNWGRTYCPNLRSAIKYFRPHAWCPMCGADGGIKKGCTSCNGSGWLRLLQWKAVPADIREQTKSS